MSPSPPGVTSTRRNSDEHVTGGGDRRDAARLTYQFGPFRLSVGDASLTRNDAPVALAPKPFDTLAYLVAHPQRTISKQELLDQIWPGTFVTDDVLVQCVVEVRRVLGDSAKDPKYVQTLPKRGYRFVADVAVAAEPVAPDAAVGHSPELLALPPNVAVFPQPVVRTADTPMPPAGRRTRAAVWVAVACAALVATAAATWWMMRAPADATKGAAAYRGEPGTLAVLPIQMVEASSDTAWLRDGLAEIIASEVTHDPSVRVMPRQRVASALLALGHDGSGLVPSEMGLRVARELGVERLITGSFQRVGGQFILSARIVNAASGAVERQVEVKGERRAQLLDAVGDMCRKLADALPTAAARATATRGISPPTRSEPAYRAFTEALQLEARGGRDNSQRALVLLEEATTHDPTFARAFLRKALVLQSRRRWGYGTDDPVPAVKAARALESRLPDRERLLVAGMGSLLLDGKPTRAIDQWSSLLKLYPSFAEEAGVPSLVADTLFQCGRWDDLILVTEPHADTPSVPDAERAVLSALLAMAFQRRGELERSATYAGRAVDLWPVREGPAYLRVRTLQARIQLAAGQRDRALETFRAVGAHPRADVVNVTDAAWGYYMAGARGEATRLVEQALALAPNYGNAHHLRGWIALTGGGDLAAAAVDLRQAFELTPRGFGSPTQGVIAGDLAALYYVGVAQQRSGDDEAARRTWREVIARSRAVIQTNTDQPDARVVRWQAAFLIALAQARLGEPSVVPNPLEGDESTSALNLARYLAVVGRRAEALASLRHAISLGAAEIQHVTDDPNFDSLRGSPEFVRLMQSVGH